MRQYSAKLLFQWRPVRSGKSRNRRVCEERIVTFSAKSAQFALSKAKKYGNYEEFKEDHDECIVFFEFIGVVMLKDISLSFSDGEIWSEIKEMVSPMERKLKIIPKDTELDALRKKSPEWQRHLRYY